MKDFEGAPLFDDSEVHGRGKVFVGADVDNVGNVWGFNHQGISAWRMKSELRPINADGVAFLAIARAGAK